MENFDKVKNDIKKIWDNNKFDPNGSYTGNTINKDMPIQDQDDL